MNEPADKSKPDRRRKDALQHSKEKPVIESLAIDDVKPRRKPYIDLPNLGTIISDARNFEVNPPHKSIVLFFEKWWGMNRMPATDEYRLLYIALTEILPHVQWPKEEFTWWVNHKDSALITKFETFDRLYLKRFGPMFDAVDFVNAYKLREKDITPTVEMMTFENRPVIERTPEHLAGQRYVETSRIVDKGGHGLEILAAHITFMMGKNEWKRPIWQYRILPDGKEIRLNRFEDYLLLPAREGLKLPSLRNLDANLKTLPDKKGMEALMMLREAIPDWDEQVKNDGIDSESIDLLEFAKSVFSKLSDSDQNDFCLWLNNRKPQPDMDIFKSPYGGVESKESGADGKFFAGQNTNGINLFKRPPRFAVFGQLGHRPSQYHAFLCGNLYRGIDGWKVTIEYAEKMRTIEYPVHLIYPEGWDGPQPNPFQSYEEYEERFLRPILTDVEALREILRKHRISELIFSSTKNPEQVGAS